MSDLRTRFRSLDDLRTPDLWSEIEARASAAQPVGVGRLRWVLIGALLLLIVALAGAALLGSGIVKWPVSLEASPRPSASLQAGLEKDQAVVIAWQPGPPGGPVSFEVIVALRNSGHGWVRVDRATYEILNRAGAPITGQGLFGPADTIGPGQTDYLNTGVVDAYQTKEGSGQPISRR